MIWMSEESVRLATEFLNKPECKRALNGGSQWALVFGPHTGIGVPVEITVMSEDGTILRQDITDVASW